MQVRLLSVQTVTPEGGVVVRKSAHVSGKLVKRPAVATGGKRPFGQLQTNVCYEGKHGPPFTCGTALKERRGLLSAWWIAGSGKRRPVRIRLAEPLNRVRPLST